MSESKKDSAPLEESETTEDSQEKLSWLSMIQSVFAAIFGIQSDKNRQKDFKKGDASQFMMLGIIAVVGIMITMAVLVSSVLDSAGQ